ncbi:hypothetical protein [Streptomyces alanosinicus]|uniref:Uncharacterized protein n=1 Tax=Streptomyces alanosinicus TaxID=68171 RepID=A0A918YNV2_9ACTN|nr:hypothetical protein [Streptomyces alanosinicus]GHE10969.1 hypothetical protein GCM10010339_68900 [Streptomyces alanosinicus]
MTYIEEVLSRALLVRNRTVPRDIIPPSTTEPRCDISLAGPSTAKDSASAEAAQDLRTLCEILITYTPTADFGEFVTDQVPEPRSALALACVLQLTSTDDGARYWWQYAAGAGQPVAAYCLYLDHLARGEKVTADWWRRQTDAVQPPPEVPVSGHPTIPWPDRSWFGRDAGTSATSILRVLIHVAKCAARPRTTAVTDLMAYVPAAVASGYLRQPEAELPLPGAQFARQIRSLLASAANRPCPYGTFPANTREETELGTSQHPSGPPTAKAPEAVHPQIGEAARH